MTEDRKEEDASSSQAGAPTENRKPAGLPKLKRIIPLSALIAGSAGVIFVVYSLLNKRASTPTDSSPETAEEFEATVTEVAAEIEKNKEEIEAQKQRIVSLVQTTLPGNTNQGDAYLRGTFTDRRVTEEEEYFASVDINIDEYANDQQRERDQAYLIIGKLVKALYTANEKIAFVQVNAYRHENGDPDIALSVKVEGDAVQDINWTQDERTLYLETLFSKYAFGVNDYWIYD